MRNFFGLLLLILFASCSLFAQRAPDAAELSRLLDEFLVGAGPNDAAVHERFWADDLIYTRGVGQRIGKAELMKGVRAAPAAKPGDPVSVYSSEDVRIQQYGNAAVVAFKLVGTTTKTDGTKSVTHHLNTGTFIKRNGRWQVVAWQATSIPKLESQSKGETQAIPSAPKTLVMTPTPTSPNSARTYSRGSRGGCYYLNARGIKTYVDHSYCK
jgi:ketosteroid isomerase-like protein